MAQRCHCQQAPRVNDRPTGAGVNDRPTGARVPQRTRVSAAQQCRSATAYGGRMAHSGEFGEAVVLDVDGYDVRLSSPDRSTSAERGETKLDLAHYYESVGPGSSMPAQAACMLHRFPDGGPKGWPQGPPESACRGSRRGGTGVGCTSALRPPRRPDSTSPRLADVLWAVRCRRSSSTRGAMTDRHRSPTGGGSTWIRCPKPFPARAPHRGRTTVTSWRNRCRRLSWASGGRDSSIYVRSAPSTSSATCPGGARLRPRGRASAARRCDDDLVAEGPRSGGCIFVDYNQNAATARSPPPIPCRQPRGTVSAPLNWDEIADAEPTTSPSRRCRAVRRAR